MYLKSDVENISVFEDILQSNGDVIIRRGFIAWLNRDRIRPEPCARRADAPGTVKAETNVLTDSIRVLATDDNADGYNHIIRGGETYSEGKFREGEDAEV